MKRVAIILLILSFGIENIKAQNCPLEWNKYKSDSYISDIQNGYNKNDMSETDFKNYLLNIARTNLAKQIQVKIDDTAKLEKIAVNGRTSINYTASTEFHTQVELHLVKTITQYDAKSKEGYAVAYIDRTEAFYYHKQQIEKVLMKAEAVYEIAQSYIESGFKNKAQEELNKVLPAFDNTFMSYDWLAILGRNESAKELYERQNLIENKIKRVLSDLQYSTKIYFNCNADIFGQKSTDLENKLKGILSIGGCSFVQTPAGADWIIEISSTSREYNKVDYGKNSIYFAYVDAEVSITKNITSQCIYEDMLSIKGGHTLDYKKAALKAYDELSKSLGDKITEVITQ